ncbi:uncharacterized protein LOC129928981 [Biomphalaria glabrata]|uniref:Uncharacterized protein LOC129928981 n=1 Tax=Biomphalaria glabrata TaxID=6526 RepID=A0A9W3BQ02_BIOGL|nr:uncharacterized protein LOC129928981 [Biomphalaria glabrata]
MTAQHTCWTTSLKMVFNVHVLTVLLCLSHALCLTESLQGNSHSNFSDKTTRISRPNSPLVIDYVQQANDSKARRGTYNATSYNWPNDIPYVIDPSFTGDRVTLGQVMTYISSRVCVTFHNVTDTFDESDPNWLHDHGYQTRAHLVIRESNGCFSEHGQGGGVGSRYSSPCHEFHCHGVYVIEVDVNMMKVERMFLVVLTEEASDETSGCSVVILSEIKRTIVRVEGVISK